MTIKLVLKSVSLMHCLLRNTGLVIGRSWLVVVGLIFFSLTGCGADGEQGTTIPTNPIPSGASADLAWDSVNDSSVIGYYIHYGKQSPNQPGSCAYEQKKFVSSTQGTVTDLDPGLTYYFAVSAYNGVEGNCSNEVFTHT